MKRSTVRWRLWRRTFAALLGVGVASGISLAWVLWPPAYPQIVYPDGKAFAFSIVDDADAGTLENVRPVYTLLEQSGLRTTKTVWVLPSNAEAEWANRGDTLAREEYRNFILELQERGFEIALHGVRGGNSERAEIASGLDLLSRLLGAGPTMHINHYQNSDNLYWGPDRLNLPPLRWLYRLASGPGNSRGHLPGSAEFWGDLARERIRYVVDFSFREINLLKVNPSLPFHDPLKPYVQYWFETSDGAERNAFVTLLGRENLDRLERERGVSIVYTHFGKGFVRDGVVDPEVRDRIADLARRNGWFAPASAILDFLRESRGGDLRLSWRERARLELLWTFEKLRYGGS